MKLALELFGLALMVLLPLSGLLVLALGVPLWLLRVPLQVRVLDPRGQAVPGAVVYGHITRRFGGYVGPSGTMVESSTEERTVRLGRTGADGALKTTLFLTQPWALHAVGPGGRSQTKRLKEREPGQGWVVDLHLQGPGKRRPSPSAAPGGAPTGSGSP